MHGGASIGPQTRERLDRCRTASLKHGLRSAEVIALRRETTAIRRALQNLIVKLNRS
jgi:hypothetical protein